MKLLFMMGSRTPPRTTTLRQFTERPGSYSIRCCLCLYDQLWRMKKGISWWKLLIECCIS